ncbi:SDR family oxidoreductase [Candidatus Saccharibacteria bacterium]|nr:SDR family oxidoreductase [Candidatus Saccharibacteria bacterium]
MVKNKRVLIAGGAGFLGSYFCDYYVSQDWLVDCVDNLSTSSGHNIEHLKSKSNFNFVRHDIINPLPRKIMTTKYGLVINLASPASPPQYRRLAIETLQAGSQGTLNLLELAKNSNARFCLASTSEVYGDPEVHPQPESYWGMVHSYGPRSMYDEAKRYAEALVYAYRQKHRVDTVVARFFNTYGPRMDPADGRVVSNFVVQALKGQPLTIYGTGNQTRSFCYVDDLVEGVIKLIDSSQEGPMNLGNPTEFTILELAKKIRRLTSTSSRLVYKPLPGDDPLQRRPDITLAKQRLGWQPKANLDSGLKKTIAYFKEELGIS